MDDPFRRSAQRSLHLAAALIAIGPALAGLGGCTGATISPSASEASEPSVTVMTPTPTLGATETPTGSPVTTPSASVAPTLLPSTDALPSLGPVIPGRWTGLRWIAGPPSPELTPEKSSDPKTEISIGFRVFGWSRGYVGFRSRQESPLAPGGRSSLSITAETSPDGLRWTRRGVLALPDGYDPEELSNYPMTITDVVEGPAGLLAVGRIPVPIISGWPAAAIWTSTDGRSWLLLDVDEAFGDQPWAIDAGSVGYIATGWMSPHEGNPQLIWTSSDGRTWHRSDLSAASLENVQTRDATAFAGGYVLAGEIYSEEGGADSFTLTPALWWSADGETWKRDTLPGSTPSILPANVMPYPDWDVTMTVHRISDHALVAVQWSEGGPSGEPSPAAWTSTDGRSWTLMPGVDLSSGNLLRPALVLSNGQRAVVLRDLYNQYGPAVVLAFADDLSLVTLHQTGTPPTDCWTSALGPTGLVVVDSTKHRFVVGVPTGG
jgi:hypothetical protein